MQCQHNKGHPDCFHGCQNGNNANGHHDRFILLWRQGEVLQRPGAVALFAERNERAEQKPLWHTDAGTRPIFVLAHLSAYIHTAPSLHPRLLFHTTMITWAWKRRLLFIIWSWVNACLLLCLLRSMTIWAKWSIIKARHSALFGPTYRKQPGKLAPSKGAQGQGKVHFVKDVKISVVHSHVHDVFIWCEILLLAHLFN